MLALFHSTSLHTRKLPSCLGKVRSFQATLGKAILAIPPHICQDPCSLVALLGSSHMGGTWVFVLDLKKHILDSTRLKIFVHVLPTVNLLTP